MKQAFREKLERYRQYKEEHPGETQAFYAKHFSIDGSTISRWNDKLQELSIEDRIRAKLEKEFEARVQAVVDKHEAERAEAAAKKEEAERRKSENRHQHHARTFKECARVDIYPSKTEDVTWNGHRVTLIGGQKNTVPEVIAGVWRDSQNAKQQSANTIARYTAGQYLGRM